jgi:hypothetical protein
VDGVELARLRRRQVDALLRDDAQTRFLELGVDLAGQVALGRVGLDDRQRAFDGHVSCLLKPARRARCPPPNPAPA